MLIIEKEPKSISAEAYRTIRTNIQYSSYDMVYKTIVITSSIAGEGKTTTAGNLALALAQEGKKVILIDCDLRKPNIHKKFRVSNSIGLSDILVGNESVDNAILNYNNNLNIITSGKIPPNPAEMLGSKAIKELLKELSFHYDHIILDTSPIVPVTDARLLATNADGVILVIKANKTKKSIINKTIGSLRKVKVNIIGTVLNGIDKVHSRDCYYYEIEEKTRFKSSKKSKVKSNSLNNVSTVTCEKA